MTQLELSDDVAVFSLNSGATLCQRICRELDVAPARQEEREFEDGEHKIRPLESVGGRDCFVVVSLFGDDELSLNDKFVRMLTFVGALRDGGAAKITVVAPYLCYARKDMKTKARDPVTTRYIAQLIEAMGTDRIVVVDVHNRAAFQNAFRIPTVHLTAAPLLADECAKLVDGEQVVAVSPDAGGVKRVERFRQLLEDKLDTPVASAFVEKYRSQGVVRGGRLIGDVDGQVAIILDDLVSSGTTLDRAARSCLDSGAIQAFSAVTHGVFSAGASQTLRKASLEKILVLDTISPGRLKEDVLRERIEVIDCAPLLAEAIARLHACGSIEEMAGQIV